MLRQALFTLLLLAPGFAEPIPTGLLVKFEGRAETFQREPFLLTLEEGVILPR